MAGMQALFFLFRKNVGKGGKADAVFVDFFAPYCYNWRENTPGAFWTVPFRRPEPIDDPKTFRRKDAFAVRKR